MRWNLHITFCSLQKFPQALFQNYFIMDINNVEKMELMSCSVYVSFLYPSSSRVLPVFLGIFLAWGSSSSLAL